MTKFFCSIFRLFTRSRTFFFRKVAISRKYISRHRNCCVKPLTNKIKFSLNDVYRPWLLLFKIIPISHIYFELEMGFGVSLNQKPRHFLTGGHP